MLLSTHRCHRLPRFCQWSVLFCANMPDGCSITIRSPRFHWVLRGSRPSGSISWSLAVISRDMFQYIAAKYSRVFETLPWRCLSRSILFTYLQAHRHLQRDCRPLFAHTARFRKMQDCIYMGHITMQTKFLPAKTAQWTLITSDH